MKTEFKIAMRNLRKHKGYSFLNIAGLALGLACCVLMLLFVQDELSYDRFHDNADRIYRVVMDAQPPNAEVDRFAITSRPVGRMMRETYPEIEALVRLNNWGPTVNKDGESFYDDRFLFAEPTFFEVFSFPLLKGDPATALNEPYALVLTASMEEKYFGEESALGQSLTLNDTLAFAITGVMADIPRNAHFTTDFLVSYESLLTRSPEGDNWLNLGGYTYLLLEKGADVVAFEEKMSGLVTEHYGPTLESLNFSVDLGLQPLTSIHLYSDRQAEWGPNGDITYVYLFSAIALFILLIACINFMNLATARSMERAKEVGIRKVVGSSRGLLIRQFLSESVVMCLFALVIAAILMAVALPFFNDLSGKEITFAALLRPQHLAALVGLTLAVGLLAGSYPAFLLSGFPTIEVLRGTFKSSRKGVWLRKGLVVFQFAISVALIASTAVVFNQLHYMRGQDLGFEKEQVLVVGAQDLPRQEMIQQYETVKSEFLRLPSVSSVSTSNTVPGRSAWLQIYSAEGLAENDSRRAHIAVIDHDYLDTYEIDMLVGRDFSLAFETDAQEAVLVNEAAVENIGWGTPEEALGKTINLGGGERTVVGVVKDYHHYSLKQALEPMLLLTLPQTFQYFSIRLNTADAESTVKAVEETWSTLFPGYAFDSFFLDADFDNQYQTELELTRIFGTFAFIAILIACLGLFGLAAFMAEQRTKEIGVRKVLGATVPNIITLLSKEFTTLVLVAIVVAVPVTYYGMDLWLEAFPYRVGVGAWVFVAAGLAALLIAFLTVSYQSIKAAVANPVEALRSE